MIITIDGPSGTGKTTIAKLISEKLGFSYFDTGAMYRSVAWFLKQRHILFSDAPAVAAALECFSFKIDNTVPEKKYFVGQEDVTQVIRSPEITLIVSEISAMPVVRKLLTAAQRDYGSKGNAVFEGRDMGSVVFPHAEFKFFLTASPEIRATRRFIEWKEKNPSLSVSEQEILEAINKRDELDSSRELAPLCCPIDARVIDTSSLNVDQVVNIIYKNVKKIKDHETL